MPELILWQGELKDPSILHNSALYVNYSTLWRKFTRDAITLEVQLCAVPPPPRSTIPRSDGYQAITIESQNLLGIRLAFLRDHFLDVRRHNLYQSIH